MTRNENLTIDYVQSTLNYDPETGSLTWKIKGNNQYVYPGKSVGWITDKGYLRCELNRQSYYVHDVIWFLVTGKWPKEQIDHDNGVKNDNRWDNLREATNSQNQANSKPFKKNKLGLKGVYKETYGNGFRAQIKVNGEQMYLGYFKTKEEAALAYNKAALKYFGEFAYLNEVKV